MCVLSGTVIFAHTDAALVGGVMNMLRINSPCVHVEQTTRGAQALMMQSLMRADAVVMGMNLPDMSGLHLLRELKNDIVDPYVMVCTREQGLQAERRILRMGANSVVHAPVDIARVCAQIENQLSLRSEGNYFHTTLEETMLQRVFAEYGIPCSMKGYVYLKCALRMLCSGQSSIEAMGELYERIASQHASNAKSIERSMRYAIARCWENRGAEEKRPGNREFLMTLMEECRGGRQTLIKPRVSVLGTGRRVFR